MSRKFKNLRCPLRNLFVPRFAFLRRISTPLCPPSGHNVHWCLLPHLHSLLNYRLLRIGTKGLTLIELMLVITLMGILAGIATPQLQSFKARAEGKKIEKEMKLLESEILMFNIERGRFPDSLAEIGFDTLKDPWGNPYQYLNIETAKGKGKMRKDHKMVPVNNDFDLYSMGPDGKSKSPFTAKHSRDDYVRANDGAFFGYVSEY